MRSAGGFDPREGRSAVGFDPTAKGDRRSWAVFPAQAKVGRAEGGAERRAGRAVLVSGPINSDVFYCFFFIFSEAFSIEF